jgi:hypothetical protein
MSYDPWTNLIDPDEYGGMDEVCPTCIAEKGEQCTDQNGVAHDEVHAARAELAQGDPAELCSVCGERRDHHAHCKMPGGCVTDGGGNFFECELDE